MGVKRKHPIQNQKSRNQSRNGVWITMWKKIHSLNQYLLVKRDLK